MGSHSISNLESVRAPTQRPMGGGLWVINFDSYHAICLDIEMPCKCIAINLHMHMKWNSYSFAKLEKLISCCFKGEKYPRDAAQRGRYPAN